TRRSLRPSAPTRRPAPSSRCCSRAMCCMIGCCVRRWLASPRAVANPPRATPTPELGGFRGRCGLDWIAQSAAALAVDDERDRAAEMGEERRRQLEIAIGPDKPVLRRMTAAGGEHPGLATEFGPVRRVAQFEARQSDAEATV